MRTYKGSTSRTIDHHHNSGMKHKGSIETYTHDRKNNRQCTGMSKCTMIILLAILMVILLFAVWWFTTRETQKNFGFRFY
jgi:cobalamin biosynthesis Mg chelatase CobN